MRINSKSRPTILFLVHSWGGGTIRYVRELAAALDAKANVVFAWGVENRSLHISRSDPEKAEQSFDLCQGLSKPLSALGAMGIDRADVVCPIGLERYVDMLIERLAVPYDATLYGFFYFSKSPLFEDVSGIFIGDTTVSALAAAEGSTMRPLLQNAERIIACSRDLAHRAAQFVPRRAIIPVRISEPGPPQNLPPLIEPLIAGSTMRVLSF